MPDRHQPLRDDVRLLGAVLGDTIREQEGEALFEHVEEVRGLSKKARAGDDQAAAALRKVLGGLDAAQVLPLARSFAHFLNLANIAEQHHRVRRRRQRQAQRDAKPQPGSCVAELAGLVEAGVAPADLAAAVRDLRVELVLTAHPTQALRRTILGKHHRVAELLSQRDRPDLSPAQEARTVEELRAETASVWLTDELRTRRPTPVDEAVAGMVLVEKVLWDVMPRYLRELDRALEASTGERLGARVTPVRMASWMGGDRDGNPFVTPDVTREVCLLARWMAADLFHKEVEELRFELSMNQGSPELMQRVGPDSREPYRDLLRAVRDRLDAGRTGCDAELRKLRGEPARARTADADAEGAEPYSDSAELAADLDLVDRSLRAVGGERIADGRLLDLRRRVGAFGLALLRLDIRQDSAVHERAATALTEHLGLGAYADWSEERRLEFLAQELGSKRPLIPRELPEAAELRLVMSTLEAVAEQRGESFGAFVISMATRASDVLLADLFQKEAGLTGARRLRVAPLFETRADLAAAEEVLDRLLSIPAYAQRIDGRQEVMIGYSDSAKDAGRLAASWALYTAQEGMVRAGRKHGVELTLFHGRGGTVGRGGGPTWLAIASQPPGSVDGRLRVTVQGEMIEAQFGLPGIALRNLELYTTATLHSTLQPASEPEPDWRACMDRLADEAAAAYRAVVRDNPDFVPYFRAATPEPELGRLNIGSRPARRRAGGGIETLRAIPWVFAWTQTRLMLPGWLGTGSALTAAAERGEMEQLRAMARDWTFFRSTLDLIDMVLAKTAPEVHEHYDAELVDETLRPLGDELRAALAQTKRMVLDIKQQDRLLADNPVLQRSIEVRNPYVDPLNLLQAELLRRLRDADDPRVERAFLVTVAGVAAGMRNTG